jgi:CRISPR-associated protein Csd1
MIEALVTAYDALARSGKLPPDSFRTKKPNRIVRLIPKRGGLPTASINADSYSKKSARGIKAPSLARTNEVKPLLLCDKAEYVFGEHCAGATARATKLHQAYLDLLQDAAASTGNRDLDTILAFLLGPDLARIAHGVAPEELVTFLIVERNGAERDPLEDPAIHKYWSEHVYRNSVSDRSGNCACCRQQGAYVRIMPNDVTIAGQAATIISFDKPAFEHYGEKQGVNSSLCMTCAHKVGEALAYLTTEKGHHSTLYDSKKRGSIQNQVAVYWSESELAATTKAGGINYEDLLAAITSNSTPNGTSDHVQRLLDSPWRARATTTPNEARIHLLVLSTITKRLVLRHHYKGTLAELRNNLTAYLNRVTALDPKDGQPRTVPLTQLRTYLGDRDSHTTNALLSIAFTGARAPSSFTHAAYKSFTQALFANDPKDSLSQPDVGRSIAAALQLATDTTMQTPTHTRAYELGRLFAMLERAQQIVSGFKAKDTIVQQAFHAVVNSPSQTFGRLLRNAEVNHFRRCGALREEVEQSLVVISEAGGFPRRLTPDEKSVLALGLYNQRAAYRKVAGADGEDDTNFEGIGDDHE